MIVLFWLLTPIVLLFYFRLALYVFSLAVSLYIYKNRKSAFQSQKDGINEGIISKDTKSKAIFNSKKQRFINGILKLSINITGNIRSHTIRNFVYRHFYLMDLAKDSVIYHGCELRDPWNISIAPNTIIGDNCILDGRCGIKIDSNVNVSSEVKMWTGQHDPNCPDFSFSGGPIEIESRVWVSSNSIILPNVVIKKNVVIAAGSIVTKSINEDEIVAGVPAKIITNRENSLSYTLSGEYDWFI